MWVLKATSSAGRLLASLNSLYNNSLNAEVQKPKQSENET